MVDSYIDEFMCRDRHGRTAFTAASSLFRDISLRYPQLEHSTVQVSIKFLPFFLNSFSQNYQYAKRFHFPGSPSPCAGCSKLWHGGSAPTSGTLLNTSIENTVELSQSAY